MSVSVCTLAKGRAEHLHNLVLALRESCRPPGELVVAVLQRQRYDLPAASFPIRQIMLDEEGTCLARGRNEAARSAAGELLVFLDVDCIAHPRLIDDYVAAARQVPGVLMGEVGYLPKGATEGGLDFAEFERLAVKHSERAGPPVAMVGPCKDYRCFWSLNFAMRRSDFEIVGGFDTRYVGYGGEDTDFGRMIAQCGLQLSWVRGAKAYHQYHPHHMPPVHHLDSVLTNAQVFARKWGEPTMQHWLRAFRLMGLIDRTPTGWRKLRDPDEEDLRLTRQQEHQPYASSADVLELLEAEAAARAANDTSPGTPVAAIAAS